MEGYREFAEEILDCLSRLTALGEERGQEDLTKRLRALEEKLKADHFHIVVMGQFKRGKTTFINSLLGSPVLPSSVIPLTSVNTLLRYGEEPVARVHYQDGREEKVALDRLPDLVTEKGNPENRLGVRAVEVFYPAPCLDDGVCFVDTPGVGSTFIHNDEMAYSYLCNADAVVFMLSADPPVSRAELDFLHHIRSFVDKIFFVQNKVDYIDPEELEESLQFNAGVIAEALGRETVEIFPLSAKTALKAAATNDPRLAEESLLPRFTRRLEDFLLKEKGVALLQSTLKNLLKILNDEISGVELEKTLLLRPWEDLRERITLFREEMSRLCRERDEMMYLLDGDFKSLVADTLDAQVEEFKKETVPVLLRRYDEFCAGKTGLGGHAFQEEITQFVKDLILQSFTEWRYREEEVLSSRFQEITEIYRDKANAIVSRILEKAGHIFDLELTGMEAEIGLEKEGEFWFKLEERQTDIEMFIGAFTKVMPRRISHRILARQNREKLLELFDRHCGRVRYDFFLRLQKSFDSLRVMVYDLIEGTMGSVEKSVDRAVGLREHGEKDVASSIRELDGYLRKMQEVRETLEALTGRLSAASTV